MKVFKTLSRYVLDKNGDVFERKTGEKVEPLPSGEVKLVTDEIFKSSITGKKTNLVRRYTRDEIIARFNNKDSVDVEKFKEGESKPAEPVVVKATITPKEKPASGDQSEFKFEILGNKYRNAKEASVALGVSVNTITNRVKKGVEGYVSL